MATVGVKGLKGDIANSHNSL